jgi:xylulose-5-phosphate/fructose-6-phosphate phosphoketolase
MFLSGYPEMLCEPTLEDWLEGYFLTGRHGFFSPYEAFIHIIDSIFNLHANCAATPTDAVRI